MNIVLLESLGIGDESLNHYADMLAEKGHRFTAYQKDSKTEVLIERAKEADILMLANMPLPEEVVDACPNLKFIDVAFTGVDHIPLEAARRREIAVSNAAGYATQAVVELTLCMMLALLRNVPQVEECCRNGRTKEGLVGSELAGKTVGIIGTGAIGCGVAKVLQAFSCRLLAYDPYPKQLPGVEMTYVSLEELLMESDIVTVHCPLTAETVRLINRERIARMKPGAFFINAARGPVVDNQALADALNDGAIAGAGIDVFDTEPPLPSDEPLLGCKNAILTPHIAFASKESMELRAKIVFDNILNWMAGKQSNRIL